MALSVFGLLRVPGVRVFRVFGWACSVFALSTGFVSVFAAGSASAFSPVPGAVSGALFAVLASWRVVLGCSEAAPSESAV